MRNIFRNHRWMLFALGMLLFIACTKKSEQSSSTESLPPPRPPAATEEKTMTPPESAPATTPAPSREPAKGAAKEPAARLRVKIETSIGTIVVELRPDKAPLTCENFLKLVNQRFYDGLIFHRVIPGFMIQGGSPDGTGGGSPGYTVPAEITDLKHAIGALATARVGDEYNPSRASSGSQFYITVAPRPDLDGGYTVFGYVVEGQEVANQISLVKRDPGDKPLTPVKIVKMSVVL
ncbi:MAG: peptidylprolyl isomerase [bacterium]